MNRIALTRIRRETIQDVSMRSYRWGRTTSDGRGLAEDALRILNFNDGVGHFPLRLRQALNGKVLSAAINLLTPACSREPLTAAGSWRFQAPWEHSCHNGWMVLLIRFRSIILQSTSRLWLGRKRVPCICESAHAQVGGGRSTAEVLPEITLAGESPQLAKPLNRIQNEAPYIWGHCFSSPEQKPADLLWLKLPSPGSLVLSWTISWSIYCRLSFKVSTSRPTPRAWQPALWRAPWVEKLEWRVVHISKFCRCCLTTRRFSMLVHLFSPSSMCPPPPLLSLHPPGGRGAWNSCGESFGSHGADQNWYDAQSLIWCWWERKLKAPPPQACLLAQLTCNQSSPGPPAPPLTEAVRMLVGALSHIPVGAGAPMPTRLLRDMETWNGCCFWAFEADSLCWDWLPLRLLNHQGNRVIKCSQLPSRICTAFFIPSVASCKAALYL